MAVEVADVAAWLGVSEDALVEPARVLAAVLRHARARYTEPTEDEDELATWDQAIVMQTARLCTRQNSVNGSSGGPGTDRAVVVDRFDGDIAAMLVDFLKVPGLFGPSPNYPPDEES